MTGVSRVSFLWRSAVLQRGLAIGRRVCLSVCLSHAGIAGADPGFWFGRGTGRGTGDGGLGTEVPQLDPGQSHGGGLGPSPPKTGRKLRREAKKTTYEETKANRID